MTSPAGTSPLPRGFHTTAYDALNDRLVLFGGHNGTYLGDTWYLQFDSPTAVAVSPNRITRTQLRSANSRSTRPSSCCRTARTNDQRLGWVSGLGPRVCSTY